MKKKKEISVLLHNIRSVHNVGSIFRTCDALGVGTIYISGYTPRPLDRFGRARSDVAKVALGAEKNVKWKQIKNPKKFLGELKEKGTKIIALEQAENSVDYKKVKITHDTIFIVGNEVTGVPKNILSLADTVAEIPMAGKKESLNVSVAFGVAMFRILNR
jgi:tRNA G18 (ribose-2'-O)-methylase SpoU